MVDDRNCFYYPRLFIYIVVWVLGYILCFEIKRIKVVYLTLLLTTLGNEVAQLI
jgi:dolichol kinase